VLGVVANVVAIVLGALIGVMFKGILTETLSKRLELALGYCVLIIGLKMAMKFENVLLLILCVALGGIIGVSMHLEENIEKYARKIQCYFSKNEKSQFATGFTMSSVLFCVGGMAIIGSINSGLLGQHEVLYTKALLDGIMNASLASVYGIGVAFSAIPVFLYQGLLTLVASKASVLHESRSISEISGVGGVLVAMIGLNLTRIAKIPVGDFLPAILLVLLIVPLLN